MVRWIQCGLDPLYPLLLYAPSASFPLPLNGSAMEFSFVCPRCQGADFSIARDRKTFAPTRAYELVFNCRCGEQLVGEEITQEYMRQYQLFKVACVSPTVAADADERLPNHHPECCTWYQCAKRRRINSKYCSARCSHRDKEGRYWRRLYKDPPPPAGPLPPAAAGCRHQGVVLKR